MKISLFKLFACTLGLVMSTRANAFQEPSRFEYLGKTSVQNIFSDSDVVNFGSCGGPNNSFIQRLQLRVERAPIEIEDLVIEYGNGERDRIQVREEFKPGTTSRLIELEGGSRCVTRAFIRARTLGFFVEGIVHFYGYRSQNQDHRSAFLLGRTSLDYSRDADRILVSRCDGRDSVVARKVQLQVRGNDANIDEVIVTFGNGDVAKVPVRETFAERSWSAVKDLPGDQRCIREIFVMGRTLNNRYNGGHATLDVYGIR